MVEQSAAAVAMIRPCCFYPNPETASDNAFQTDLSEEKSASVSRVAREEFDKTVCSLLGNGIRVHVFDDTALPEKPDAIFPNNWFSTHHDGRVAIYPMYSVSRRNERRHELIDELGKEYLVRELVDYTAYEARRLYLEGTGSLVLDYVNRIAYVSLSKRSSAEVVTRFCGDFDYAPAMFESVGNDGRPIYHTNVMLCLGSEFALAGLELIPDPRVREIVCARLKESGKNVIELDRRQIAEFAGNALELRNDSEKLLILSARALASLRRDQRGEIERYARLVPLVIPTIELAGGSARCMMAAIYLPARVKEHHGGE